MANPTTNIGMTKPTVGGSTDTWGTTINENVVDIIDALFSISGTDVTMSDITFNSLSMQETGSGTDTVKIQAPSAVTTAYTLTMPAAVGSTNQVLSAADGSGTLAWTTPETGDITGVTAGTGLSGGGTSGTVTLNVEAAQTQITSVGALGAGSISSGFGAIDVGSSSIDGGTITGTFAGNLTGNVTGNCSGTAGSATGNAATATALATARAINGTDFDGTAAITVTAAAGTVTGATLNSGVTASSLTSVGTLTSLGVGAITSTGNFVTTATGPHAIGNSVLDFARLRLSGNFTSGGAATEAAGIWVDGALTGASGDTGFLTQVHINPAITTQNATESIGVVSSLRVEEPTITDNLTGDITTAATVWIEAAPTEGQTNSALHVASGATYLGGTVKIYVDNSNTQTAETQLLIEQDGSGDAVLNWKLSGATDWYAYVDNSDGDKWKLRRSTTDWLTVTETGLVTMAGALDVTGALSKGSGSFKIDHPLPDKKDTHHLVHSFHEGPRADLWYRGEVALVSGSATVDLDEAAGMSAGTWELLCRDPQVWIQNDSGWSGVRGSVEGNILTIESKDIVSDDTVSWMVVAERCDQHMIDTDWTDDEGRVIVEPEKPLIVEPEQPSG